MQKTKNHSKKYKSSAMNMLALVQNRTDTPAILNRKVSNINSLRIKKCVEQIQL